MGRWEGRGESREDEIKDHVNRTTATSELRGRGKQEIEKVNAHVDEKADCCSDGLWTTELTGKSVGRVGVSVGEGGGEREDGEVAMLVRAAGRCAAHDPSVAEVRRETSGRMELCEDDWFVEELGKSAIFERNEKTYVHQKLHDDTVKLFFNCAVRNRLDCPA